MAENTTVETSTENPASQDTNQAQGQPEGSNPQPAAGGNGAKLYTQAELDALIEGRLARERKKHQQQPAAQTATPEGTDVGTAPAVVEVDVTEDARQQANAIIAKANQRLIQAIAQSEATKLNINPDYIADAVRLADLSAVTVSEDGTVDTKSVTAALEAVLTRMPVLKAAQETPVGGFKVGGQGGNNPQNNGWTNTGKPSGETKRWNKNRY